MLIEMLFDDLMKFFAGLHPTLIRQMHWRVFRFCQKAAPDSETIRCTDEFSILSESCTWRWNDQMHWRIFDVARKLHLTLKRSDALTNFRWCQKGCILMIECIGGFPIYLAVSTTGVVARFWLFGDADRQTDKQANRAASRQTERDVRWNDVCWLLKQANWFAKKWWKQWFSRDAFKKRAESKLSTNNWSWRF